MVYREDACEFCSMPAAVTCPRCASRVCDGEHACMDGTRHCGVCERELREDLEEARILVDMRKPDRSGNLFAHRDEILDEAWSTFAHALARRRVRKRFARRTVEDIREWRRTAGVKLRGQ